MDERTRQHLRDINRAFYEREAQAFASTREHPWPGWTRVLAAVPAEPLRVLDVGCGNGRLARFLSGPRKLEYRGIDTSRALVAAAAGQRSPAHPGDDVRFEVRAAEDPPPGPFDLVAVFGLLHHVPAFESRIALLASLGRRLAPDGRLAATFWRFGNDPRFEGRLRGFGGAVDAAQLERGDHLLLWGDGGRGGDEGAHETDEGPARYCHFCDEGELEQVVARLRQEGLAVVDRFRSDGRSGEFNEYLVWGRA